MTVSVKNLPDYEQRKWLAKTFLGLDEPPELDPDVIYKLDGIFSDLFDGEIDVVELIKEVRNNHYL